MSHRNEILASLHARKSVRMFTDEPITDEDRIALIDAAAQAPTAGNQQMYTIIDVTDQGIKDELAVLCDHQPFIAQAPLVLVFAADYQKWYDAYLLAGVAPRDPGIGDLMLAVLDTAIAAQNAVVAAESLGLGSCYIGDILENAEQVGPLLALPGLVVPAVLVVFGHPTAQQAARAKPGRIPRDLLVHENRYRGFTEDDLRRMWADRLGHHSFEEWMRLFVARKYNADFSVEMTRSTAVWVEAFTTYAARLPASASGRSSSPGTQV